MSNKLSSAKKILEKYFDPENSVDENAIARAMQEYADLKCKELREENQTLKDLLSVSKSLKENLSLREENERLKEIAEAHRECFELFIPVDKWDEATVFLSTHGSGLAKDIYNREGSSNKH